MLEGLAQGFAVALQWHNILYAFAGVFLGTVLGVLPGIGPGARQGQRGAGAGSGEPPGGRKMVGGVI